MSRPFHVVVLAAGRGTRMKSEMPKVLFDICGRPALLHVVLAGASLGAKSSTVVVSPDSRAACEAALGEVPVSVTVQDPPLGTGHAARVGLEAAAPGPGADVLILYGDGPLYTTQTIRDLLKAHADGGDARGATLLSAEIDDPTGYGRVVVGADGGVERIVEELDADDATRAIREINTGIMVLRGDAGAEVLSGLSNDNAKGEYYLTDVVEAMGGRGLAVGRVVLHDSDEAGAYNSIEELGVVRDLMRRRIIRGHQANGVDVVDPSSTWIDVGVEIGAGTRVLPFTVITRGVVIGKSCVIGPFSHLRPAAELADGAEVGNFVEVKKSYLGEKAKAKHLSYIGDATIGAGTNIGCGTITANWDGKTKHPTKVGAGAFIGSGTVLIAPTTVEDGGVTGAGAVVKRGSTIGADEVWVGVPARPIGTKTTRSPESPESIDNPADSEGEEI